MFNKQNDEPIKPQGAETVIGPSVRVKGNFHGEGNMVIEGMVEGSIKTSGSLFVGDRARITASVEAKEARIGGEINGNIKAAGYINVSGAARITGDIEANTLSIEKGAILNGRITMGKPSASPAPKES
jgi:cytoskeletal protein CcmA (bactofilin family)